MLSQFGTDFDALLLAGISFRQDFERVAILLHEFTSGFELFRNCRIVGRDEIAFRRLNRVERVALLNLESGWKFRS